MFLQALVLESRGRWVPSCLDKKECLPNNQCRRKAKLPEPQNWLPVKRMPTCSPPPGKILPASEIEGIAGGPKQTPHMPQRQGYTMIKTHLLSLI